MHMKALHVLCYPLTQLSMSELPYCSLGKSRSIRCCGNCFTILTLKKVNCYWLVTSKEPSPQSSR